MNEEQLSAIRRWHEAMIDGEREIEALIEIGFTLESRLCTSITNILGALTNATAQLIGDKGCWLEWYWCDCRMGRTPMDAGKFSRHRKIGGLDDLIWLMEGGQ